MWRTNNPASGLNQAEWQPLAEGHSSPYELKIPSGGRDTHENFVGVILVLPVLLVMFHWFTAFGRDRLIRFLTFVWRILTANLIRIFHPRRLSNDKKKRRKRNIANTVRSNVAISHLSWYQRTECSALKPEHFSKGLQSCLQGKPYSTVRGFINARMSIALVRATNRCIRGYRIPASNMSNRFRWEGSED